MILEYCGNTIKLYDLVSPKNSRLKISTLKKAIKSIKKIIKYPQIFIDILLFLI